MPFEFVEPGVLADQQLQLILLKTESAGESIWHAPTYRFEIRSVASGQRVGHINLRIGDAPVLVQYVGHIGYGIDEPHRGRHFAERACRLLRPLAVRHGMTTLWITTAPDNPASRRTCERLGAELIGIFDVPEDYPLPPGSIRQKARYRWEISTVDPSCMAATHP